MKNLFSVHGVDVLCQSTQQSKTKNLKCSVLGIDFAWIARLGTNIFNTKNFSEPAILILNRLEMKLTTLEEIKEALTPENKNRAIRVWNELYNKYNGDYSLMRKDLTGELISEQELSNLNNLKVADSSVEAGNNTHNGNNLEALKSGDIALLGITRKVIFNVDSISLVAISNSKGLDGMLDNAIRIQDENIFLEDIRGISVYEGKGASNVLLNSMFGGNTDKALMESISYIRFELKGVSDNRTFSPNQHPYTVTISSTQINEAQALKNFLENKVREIRNSSRTPLVNQQSTADELLKYSTLLEKGIISNEEFEAIKKKLLGI